jgi:hypothetical protein
MQYTCHIMVLAVMVVSVQFTWLLISSCCRAAAKLEEVNAAKKPVCDQGLQ